MDAIITCPLGSQCTEIKDNKLYRCAWHVEMKGIDASGENHNEWKCSMAWMPILQTEMAGTNRGQTAAIESLRNETVKRQNIALDTMRKLNVN